MINPTDNAERSKECVEALKIAASVNDHIHEHSSWCKFCKKIAAALLEAEACGLVKATMLPNYSVVRAEALQRCTEAQQLRASEPNAKGDGQR